jgi:hypothetical protein
MELQRLWESRRGSLPVSKEADALERAFALCDAPDVKAAGIYVDQKLAAFVIFELRQKNWAVAYFEKADQSIIGVSQYMKRYLAAQLMAMGCEYISFEEDLGLVGLRHAKLSYRPVFFLKKYTISRNQVRPQTL